MSQAVTHIVEGPKIDTNLLAQGVAAKGAMWKGLSDIATGVGEGLIARKEAKKTFFEQQQDVFKDIAKEREGIDYAHLAEFDERVAKAKDTLTERFKTMKPRDVNKPEFQTWLREQKEDLAKLSDRNKSSKGQYPEILKLYNKPNSYGEKLMTDWRENEAKAFNDPTYNPNFLATAQNSSAYTNIAALASEEMSKKPFADSEHTYTNETDGFSNLNAVKFKPALGYIGKDNKFQVKVDPAITDELLKNPAFYDGMLTQLEHGTEGKVNTTGIGVTAHKDAGNGGQVQDAVRAHAQSYLEEIARREHNPQSYIKSRSQIYKEKAPTAAEQLDQREAYNAESVLKNIESGNDSPFDFYSSDPAVDGYSGFTPVYGNGEESAPTSYTATRTVTTKDKDLLGRAKKVRTEVSIPATRDGIKNFISKYGEHKTSKAKVEPTKTEKQVKRKHTAKMPDGSIITSDDGKNWFDKNNKPVK